VKKPTSITLVHLFILAIVPTFAFPLFAQQQIDMAPPTLPITTSDHDVHALTLTRFHFTTLKEFHSEVFRAAGKHDELTASDAKLINRALNAFFETSSRADLVLEALRQSKAIRLSFKVQEKTDGYKMAKDPSKELLYHFEPLMKSVPVVVEIRPLLDGPIAFEITLSRQESVSSYAVDWAGKIVS
jgi:hypothetical protein